MEPLILSKTQARRIILQAAGLSKKAPFGNGREAVYKLIDHLGFIQLDTNYVVERAHHHVIATRVPDYQLNWLQEIIADGLVFEYLTSDSGYLPMHDFRFSLLVKEAFTKSGKSLTRAESLLTRQVLERIEREGPLMVGDFENDRKEPGSGWWDWRPAKVALERLYMEGKLMITRTKNFQKVYDLPMNLVPAEIDQKMPTAEEYARFVIRRGLGALGLAYQKELAWRARRVSGNLIKNELENMVIAGDVVTVAIDGLKSPTIYMLPGKPVSIEISNEAYILSPFDILNVFRHRLRDFFNFDYQIECFVPAAKRKYGYFSLPILAGDQFVARMDAKADRKQRVLIVHNLHFEPVNINAVMIKKITEALRVYVLFNQCRDIEFKKTNNEIYLASINKGFK